jgi:hypothetical protein
MERREFWLYLLCFILFAEFSSWFTAGPNSPLCLIEPEQSYQASNNHQKDCPTFFAGSILLGQRGFEWIKRDDNDKAVVAGFTVVLAISTIGLWLATKSLYSAGERQLHFLRESAAIQSHEMQASIAAAQQSAEAAAISANHIPTIERAYVFATPQPNIEKGMTITTLFLQNFGQTPAIVTEGYGANSESEPVGQPLYPPQPSNPRFLEAVIGKGAREPFPTRWWSPITEPHFFYGYVRYTDIFRKSHVTRFCVRIFPADGRVELAGPSVWNSWT